MPLLWISCGQELWTSVEKTGRCGKNAGEKNGEEGAPSEKEEGKGRQREVIHTDLHNVDKVIPGYPLVDREKSVEKTGVFSWKTRKICGGRQRRGDFIRRTLEKREKVCYNHGMDHRPDINRAQALFEEHGEVFSAFRRLLLEYNGRYNLTAITEEKEVSIKHFLDSLAGEPLFPASARVLEVGSGAGFPSVPLMLARPDLCFTLLESTGKKCDFLKVAAREFALSCTVCHVRAEDAGKEADFRERFDVCCARAVARLNTLLEYCLPFVREGGVFLAYKGSGAEEELAEAKHALSVLGGGEVKLYPYTLPDGMGERTIVAVKKIRRTPLKYPRGRGKERSDPL